MTCLRSSCIDHGRQGNRDGYTTAVLTLVASVVDLVDTVEKSND